MINDLDKFLRNIILATAPVLSSRVFPDAAPTGTANPCLVYQLTEGDPTQLLDTGPAGEGVIAYQLRAYSDRRMEANEIRDLLGEAFENRAKEDLSPTLKIEAFEWAGLQNTYERETKEYGALSAVRFHWKKIN